MEAASGEAVVAAVPSERKLITSKPEDSGRVVTEETGGGASPCSSSSSSSPPQTHRAATIALSNGNGLYGDQRGGLTTVALPQNALIVMTTAAAVSRSGEDSKSEPGSTRLSLTQAGSRLVLSPVPAKQDTPPSTAASPPSPVPANQGVATLSLTLLPSPVIRGLVLTERIIPEAPGTLLQPASPSPSLLPFDPDSFLNSPKQGQTYGGIAHPSHNSTHCMCSSSTSSPAPSTSPQAPSLALSLSPTSPPSSLSSISSEAERKSVLGRPSSSPSSLSPLSLSLSPSRSTPELLPLCLESSLGLESLTHPLSPALCMREASSSLSAEGKAPPTGLDAPNHLVTNQLSPSLHVTNQLVSTSQVATTRPSLEVLPVDRSPTECEKVVQRPQLQVQLLACNFQQPNLTPPTSTPINGPVQVKEEQSPPTQVHFESEVTPMDTTQSSDSTHIVNQEAGLTFDSAFPDLISELITEDTVGHTPNPPVYPVRYMVPPQPTPSTSFLAFPLLTNTSDGSAEDMHRLASITDFSPEWSYPEVSTAVFFLFGHGWKIF